MLKVFAICTAMALSSVTALAQHKNGHFVPFDVPGASATPQPTSSYPLHGTLPVDINDRGEILGSFINEASTVTQTFLRYPNGRVVVSDDPSAGTAPGPLASQVGTVPYGLNDSGEAAGVVMTQDGQSFAFVRSANGAFTDFSGPQSLSGLIPGSRALSINNRAQTTGDFVDYPTADHAFIRNRDGSMITFDAPDASFSGFWNGTTATSINSFGDVCGYYHDATGAIHPFVRKHDGRITEFEVPGASTSPYSGAFASRITDSGIVIGYFYDQSSQSWGFIRFPDGKVWTLGFPQIPGGHGFEIININHRGEVLGTYLDANLAIRSFLLMRNGRLLKIDAPHAAMGAYQGTTAANLNDAGEVTGYFFDTTNVIHGFLWRERE